MACLTTNCLPATIVRCPVYQLARLFHNRRSLASLASQVRIYWRLILPSVVCCAAAVTMTGLSCSPSFAQDYMTNSGAVPIPGAGHDYVRDLAETVNPATGAVNIRVRIPLPSGRGLNLPFGVSYDSSGLHVIGGARGPQWTWPWGGGIIGSGLSLERLSTKYGNNLCYYYAGYVFKTTDGVTNALGLMKPLNPTQCPGLKSVLTGGNNIVRADVTGIPRIATADGTTYTFGTPTTVEDRNGNVMSFGDNGTTETATDTLGRSVYSISPNTLPASAPATTTITVSGMGGDYYVNWTAPTVNFSTSWTNLSPGIQCAMPTLNQGTAHPAISSIQLPNGRAFTFTYDPSYGLVSEIIYPSGGWVKYTWGVNPQSAGGRFHDAQADSNWCNLIYDMPAILHRYVSFDGTTTALQQDFSYSTMHPPGSTGWSSKQTTVTTHDLIRGTQFQTVYTYLPGGTGDPAQPGTDCDACVDAQIAAEQTVVYQDVGGATLKTESKTWYNVRQLQSDQVTLNDGSTSKTTYTYGAGDQITEKDEYDYGAGMPGPLLRKIVYNYQGFNNTAVFPNLASIFNRPCQVITYDGSGNRMAETDSFYDNGATTTPCGTAGTPSVSNAGGTSLTAHDETNYSPTAAGPRGNQTQVSRWLSTGGSVSSTYSYDETGQVTSMTDPNGQTTQYSYADNYLPGSGSPPGLTNAYVTTIGHPTVGSVTTHDYFQYAYSDGKLTASQDDNDKAAGKSTAYTYADSLRRLTETDYPDGGRVGFSYSDVAPSPTVTKTVLIIASPSVTAVTTTTMDGYSHAIKTQLTSDPEGTDTTLTTYDGLARVRTQSNPYRTTSDSTYGITTNNYDTLGRVTSIVQPDLSILTTSYAGNCTTVVDETGKSRKSCTDGLGRLIQVFEAPSTLNFETDYQYDALGNLLCAVQKATDTSPFTTCAAAPVAWRPRSFQYDSLSRILSATNPESGTISYGYDGNGNLLQKKSPKPNQTNSATTSTNNFCYDALNRATSKAYNTSACPPASPIATYTYDQGTNGIGLRTGMTDASGSATWMYDLTGRVQSETRVTSNVTKTTSYGYNQDGSVNSISYPSGRTVNYTYSGAGRALSAIDPTGPINYVTSATYAPPGELATYANGFVSGGFSGITTANVYNKRLQPVLISAASPTATVFSICYDFHSYTAINLPPCVFSANTAGDNGNVYQIVNNRDSNRTQNFNYDDLNRIKQGYTTGTNWGEDFTIDAWSNLTNRVLHAGKTNYESLNVAPASNLNQLPGFGYDAAGNMTSNGSASYTYDLENRLTNATGAVYVYDGDGERVKKNASGATLYWYGATGNVLDETSATGTLVSEYIFFNGKRVARRDSDNSVKFYFSDNLGSASVITNATGVMPPLAESDYYPYGGEIPITTGDTNHYKFTGKERDSESGLDNFGARYDSSSLGRFMTPDWAARPTTVPYATFGDPQTLNLYGYVENSPLNRIDADGHGNPDPNNRGGTDNPCAKDSQKECDREKKRKADEKKKLEAEAQRQALLLIVALIRGHHGVPRSLIKLLPEGSEIRAALEKWTTGELEGNHYYDAAHRLYTKAVETLTRLRDPEAQEELVADGVRGARRLGQEVLDSDNPAIKNFLEDMHTSSGMTGREALQKTLAGDGEAAAELAPEVIVEGAKIIVEEVPVE